MTNPQNNMSTEKTSKGKKALKIITVLLISILAAILLVLVVVYSLAYFGKKSLLGSEISVSAPAGITEEVEDNGSAVIYNGKKYVYNENIASFLFLGIDDYRVDKNSPIGKKGQADTIFLATLDTQTGAVKIIPISREIMADINLYSIEGNYAGVEKTQLCLAYAYGKNSKDSCENVKRSVSRLLYGVNVNSYFAVNLEGIEKIVDTMGGVKLTVMEDLSKDSVVLKKGQTKTLNGKESVVYIRERGDDINANNVRMKRQKQFLTAMMNTAGNKIVSDFTKVTTYYNTLKPYTTTDLTLPQISYLATTFLKVNIGNSVEYIGITGTSSMHNGSACFIADKESLYDAVIRAFYIEDTE